MNGTSNNSPHPANQLMEEVKTNLKLGQNRNPEGEPKNRNEKKSTTAEEERGLSNDEIKIQRAAEKYYSQPGGPHLLSSQAEARAAEVKEQEGLEEEEALTHKNTSAAPAEQEPVVAEEEQEEAPTDKNTSAAPAEQEPVAEDEEAPVAEDEEAPAEQEPAPVDEEEEKRYNAGSPASDGIGEGRARAYTLEEFKDFYGSSELQQGNPLSNDEVMAMWNSSKVEKRYIGDEQQKDTNYTDWPWVTKKEFITYYNKLPLGEINNKWNDAEPWTNINAIWKAIDLKDDDALNKAIQEAEIVVDRIKEINQMGLGRKPDEKFINLIQDGKEILSLPASDNVVEPNVPGEEEPNVPGEGEPNVPGEGVSNVPGEGVSNDNFEIKGENVNRSQKSEKSKKSKKSKKKGTKKKYIDVNNKTASFETLGDDQKEGILVYLMSGEHSVKDGETKEEFINRTAKRFKKKYHITDKNKQELTEWMTTKELDDLNVIIEKQGGGGRKKTRRTQNRKTQNRKTQNRKTQNRRKQSRRNQSRRKQNKRKQSRKRRN